MSTPARVEFSMSARKALTKRLAVSCRASDRAQARILDELLELTGWHRNYARAALREARRPERAVRPRAAARVPVFGPAEHVDRSGAAGAGHEIRLLLTRRCSSSGIARVSRYTSRRDRRSWRPGRAAGGSSWGAESHDHAVGRISPEPRMSRSPGITNVRPSIGVCRSSLSRISSPQRRPIEIGFCA